LLAITKIFIEVFQTFEQTKKKFYNIKIDNDESIATVSFDYSFWEKGQKMNWGKESWHLVKIKDSWKINKH